MSVRTDVINLNVNINGNQAQNNLNELRKRAADIKLEMEGLKKSTQQYKDKAKELREVNEEMVKLKQQIGITSLTQKELISELNRLKALKGSVQPFTAEFKDLQKQIEAVEDRLYDVRNGVTGFASFFSKIKDEVKQFGIMAAAYLGFDFITSQFSNIIRGAGKLSDSLADIQRVTGMTAREVKTLNAELTAMDTRTSTEGLRNIAIVAGKLGVAKNDVLDFVKATDMLVVALGDELGDADQITTQLGKIINVFDKGDGKVTGDKLQMIGNAIVDLANKGVASGGYIVDFTQRMSGMAGTANLSLDAVMGLAAGLEETGQKVESSSTAIQKILGEIGADVPKFAKIAGKSVEEFSQTLRTKPVEAMIQVSEGFTKGKTSFEDISKAFANAGEDGARMVSTLGVVGNKADWFRNKIKDTGEALKGNGEITEAFDLKNQTLGASLDKLGKDFNRLMSSSAITNFLKSAVQGTTDLIAWLKDLPNWLERNRTSLILLTGVILAYVAAKTKATQAAILNRLATLLETAADKLEAAQKIVSTAVTNAYALAKGLLTRQITLATAAQRIWTAVSAASGNVLSIVILAITAAAAAYSYFSSRVAQLTMAQKIQADVQKKAIDSYADEKARIDTLSMVVQNSALSLESRKKALKELIDINPEYLSGLTLENIKTQEGINIIDNYVAALKRKATIQAATDLQAEKIKEEMRLQQIQYSLEKKIAQKKEDLSDLTDEEQKYVGSARKNFHFIATLTDLKTGSSDAKEALDAIKAARANIRQEMKITDEIIAANYEDASSKVANGSSKKAGDAAKTVSRTIKLIKEQISTLDKDFEEIEVKNTDALRKNRDDRKKLQEELDRLEGKEQKAPKKTKAESEYEKLKKEADKFRKDLLKLRNDVEADGEIGDQAEIRRAEDKYKELTDRARKYFLAHVTTRKEYQGQEAELERLFNLEIDKIIKRRMARQGEAEYEQSLQNLAKHFEDERNLAGRNYAAGILDKKQYDAKLKQLDQQELANRIIIHQDYAANVKKAGENLVKDQSAQEKQTTQNLIEELNDRENAKRKAAEEKVSAAKVGVLTTKPNSDARLEADKAYLQAKFDLETMSMDKTSEAYKEKQAQLNNDLKDLDRQYYLAKIDQALEYIGFFQQAMSSLNTLLNNKENKSLADDRKRNEEKKKGYKNALDNKLINQAQYDKKVQELEDQQQAKEKEIRRKQAEREKALAIFNAVIATAAAVAKALPNIPLSIVAGVLGGLQVAAIASQPIPEMGTGGLLDDGPYHKDGDKGLHVVNPRTGKTEMLLEKDEAVVKGDAIRDKQQYTVTGTPSQIASALNAMHGGVNWAGGAVIEMPKWRQERPASINPGMPQIMEQGGLIRPMFDDNSSTGGSTAAYQAMVVEMRGMREDMKQWKTKLKGEWVIKDLDETRALYDNAQAASGMAQ